MPAEPISSAARDVLLASSPPRVVPQEIVRKVVPWSEVSVKLWTSGLTLCIGLVLAAFFVPRHLVEQWRLDNEVVETTSGKILTTENTRTKINGARVWKYEFVFAKEGNAEQRGIAYTSGKRWETDASVEIRYIIADPRIAMPSGARLDEAPATGAVVLIFPLLGLYGLVHTLLERNWKKRLLSHGLVGKAKVDSVEKSLFQSNGRNTYKLRMTRGDDGVQIRKSTQSIAEINVAEARLRSGKPLTLIYHRNKRKRFLIVDSWDANAARLPTERYFRENPVSAVLPSVNPVAERMTMAFLEMPAPRRIPWEIKRKAVPVDGSFIIQLMGAIFFAFGAFVSWKVLPFYLPKQWLVELGPSKTVAGEILSVEDPHVIDNNVKVFRHRFRYQPAEGPAQEGVAYRSGVGWTAGMPVLVRYLPVNPYLAVPEGARMGPSTGIVSVVLVFPLLGCAFMFGPVFLRSRKLRMLRMGVVATADITSLEKTSAKVNQDVMYKIVLDHDGAALVKRSFDAKEIAFAMRRWQERKPVKILHPPGRPNQFLLPELWNEEPARRP